VNYESQLCGLSWQIVPTEGGPDWRRFMKEEYPPHTWDIFPVAQLIAHDKTALLHHDLGQFVTNPEVVAWTLGLGFSMSFRSQAGQLENAAPREWLRWLDRLQKSVCARYVGEPVLAFRHDRGPSPNLDDDGVMHATYGPVRIVANFGTQPRLEQNRELASHGFHATAPGLVAGRLKKVGPADFGEASVSFVAEGDSHRADIWVYAPAGQAVTVELPSDMSGERALTLDGAAPLTVKAADGTVSFRLPRRLDEQQC
jgi:hypothetical protein